MHKSNEYYIKLLNLKIQHVIKGKIREREGERETERQKRESEGGERETDRQIERESKERGGGGEVERGQEAQSLLANGMTLCRGWGRECNRPQFR